MVTETSKREPVTHYGATIGVSRGACLRQEEEEEEEEDSEEEEESLFKADAVNEEDSEEEDKRLLRG